MKKLMEVVMAFIGIALFISLVGKGVSVMANYHEPYTVPTKAEAAQTAARVAANKASQEAEVRMETRVSRCELESKLRSRHPSTVSFSRFNAYSDYSERGDRGTVLSTMTAKNSMGLELEFNIECSYQGSKLVNVRISEAM